LIKVKIRDSLEMPANSLCSASDNKSAFFPTNFPSDFVITSVNHKSKITGTKIGQQNKESSQNKLEIYCLLNFLWANTQVRPLSTLKIYKTGSSAD